MSDEDKKPAVAEDAAKQEFEDWLDAMDIDIRVGDLDEKDLAAYRKHERLIVGACMSGDLTFNESREAVFTPGKKSEWNSGAIVFHERTGATLISTDKKGKDSDGAKTYAAMGDLCGIAPKLFTKLKGRDIKICEAIFVLLMD